MVTTEDIKIINDALQQGSDVRIQNTPDGYRIVADKGSGLKRGHSAKKPSAMMGYSDKRQ